MEIDSHRTIFHSARKFFSGTLLSRFSGLARDIAMAFSFGTQESVAALFVAYRFAHLLRRLLGEGAMQAAFIPHFEKLRSASPQEAARFFGNLYAVITLFLIGILSVSALFISGFLSFSTLNEGNREILTLVMILLPSLLFICLYGLNSSLLQCEQEFWLPSLAPIAFNLFWVFGALSLSQMPAMRAMPWLAGFIVIGCMAQWMITVPSTLALLRKNGVSHPWKGCSFQAEPLRQFARPLALGILGVAASQINNALDALFARYADPDGPAFLWYSIRMQQLPVGLFGVALSGALLPPLSRAHEANETKQFDSYLDYALSRSLFLIVPILFLFLLMGDRAIDFVYQRGDFTLSSVVNTTWCLWGYAVGLIPMGLVIILAPSFYAQKNYRITTIASVATVILNIALNTLFVMALGMGAAAVAVATGISAWLNAAFLLRRSSLRMIRVAGPILLLSAAASAALLAVDFLLFEGSSALQILRGELPLYPDAFWEKAMQLSFQIGAFSMVYAALGYFWRKRLKLV